jgi:hypothetical protein
MNLRCKVGLEKSHPRGSGDLVGGCRGNKKSHPRESGDLVEKRVILAKAGILWRVAVVYEIPVFTGMTQLYGIPAFAGMTQFRGNDSTLFNRWSSRAGFVQG